MTFKKACLTALSAFFASSLAACNRVTPEMMMASQVAAQRQVQTRSVKPQNRSTVMPQQVVLSFRQRLSGQIISQMGQRYGLRFLKSSPTGHVLFQHAPQVQTTQLIQSLRQDPMVANAEHNVIYRTRFTVNDPRSTEQTGLGIIGMAKAWDLTLGNPNIKIAVVDTGVDLNHPDLRDKLVPGFDALSNGQNPPQDENGHGTHAAGIAAAATDNREGVAGTAPRCKIMPVKALDATGNGDGFSVGLGIVWAADNGADVINLSLGGPHKFEAVERAIKYALSKNIPVIVAMGNEGTNELRYPASQPGVIAVGAVDFSRNLTTFSNYGQWMSVVAPGQQILSTMPVNSVFMTQEEGYMNNYDVMDGTSMAAPIVSGVVALMKSRHPNLNPAQIKQRLQGTAIDLGAPGFDERYGHGMIDAPRAIL